MYKKALVTGGDALGGEIAKYLAGQGYDIALAHGQGDISPIVREIEEKGVRCAPFGLDMADYEQAGAETDPDSGLTLGLVVANDQEHNRKVINGDLWFGAIALSAKADATEAGIIKVGTAT